MGSENPCHAISREHRIPADFWHTSACSGRCPGFSPVSG
ncbi:hypothetical protein MXB_5274 [Myxobolus squamalis]|nr:hypothetical protein MXB_5274 [Myxobolus squamalis]